MAEIVRRLDPHEADSYSEHSVPRMFWRNWGVFTKSVTYADLTQVNFEEPIFNEVPPSLRAFIYGYGWTPMVNGDVESTVVSVGVIFTTQLLDARGGDVTREVQVEQFEGDPYKRVVHLIETNTAHNQDFGKREVVMVVTLDGITQLYDTRIINRSTGLAFPHERITLPERQHLQVSYQWRGDVDEPGVVRLVGAQEQKYLVTSDRVGIVRENNFLGNVNGYARVGDYKRCTPAKEGIDWPYPANILVPAAPPDLSLIT